MFVHCISDNEFIEFISRTHEDCLQLGKKKTNAAIKSGKNVTKISPKESA